MDQLALQIEERVSIRVLWIAWYYTLSINFIDGDQRVVRAVYKCPVD
jgi:hypothetical protein